MNTNNNAHSFVISNNPQEEFYRVLSALSTVFNVPTTPHAGESSSSRNNNIPIDLSNREDADRYLTQFQRSPVAWMVADRLLSSTSHNDPQVQFFAAQTLHTKCRADILQLEFHQLNSLRDSLMDSLMKFISHGGAGVKAIVTRLAMAICCLALQMKWESIMDDLLTSLQQQQQSQQHMVEMVLIIAKILPEEVNSERVLLPNEQQRFIFVEKLVHSSEKMLQFLFYCVSTAGGNDSERVKIQEQVLRCLHSWVRYVNIPTSLLQNTQLVDFTFAILQANDDKVYSGDLFELSVDVIIEILRCYPSDNPDNMGLVQKFIPLIMDLGLDSHSPFQKALRQEDEDSMRDYCRIFTEMGESYMSLIVHHEDLNQVKLVNLVLACSAIPDNGELCFKMSCSI
jgi:transportin-3